MTIKADIKFLKNLLKQGVSFGKRKTRLKSGNPSMQELSDSIGNNVEEFEEYIQANPGIYNQLISLRNLNEHLKNTIISIQQNAVYNNSLFDYNRTYNTSKSLYNTLKRLSNRVRNSSQIFEQRLKNIEQAFAIRFPGMYSQEIQRSNKLFEIASKICEEQQDPNGEFNFGKRKGKRYRMDKDPFGSPPPKTRSISRVPETPISRVPQTPSVSRVQETPSVSRVQETPQFVADRPPYSPNSPISRHVVPETPQTAQSTNKLQGFGKKNKRFRGNIMTRPYQETPEEFSARMRRAHLSAILYESSAMGRYMVREQERLHRDAVLRALLRGQAAKMLHNKARNIFPQRKI